MLRAAVTSAVMAIGAVVASHAPAQDTSYPTRPIRFVVPYPPGGGTDTVARILARRLSESLGQQIVIDNRAGANAIIGTQIAARSPPDGYTMLLVVPAIVAVNPSFYRDLPYDPIRDFDAVSQVTLNPTVITAHPAVPASTVKDLIDLARAKPGQLNYGSSGTGSAAHLVLEQFKRMANVEIVHVPYKGGGLALNDLLGGQIQLMGGPTIAVLPSIRSGKVKAIAVTTAKRVSAMPEVPTMGETLAGYERSGWSGILMPKGAPSTAIHRVSAEVARVLRGSEAHRQLADQGLEPVGSAPSAFAALISRELDAYERLLKAAGMYRIGAASR